MNNEQLAKAIVALYATIDLTNEWSDTDELIQLAAFQLWEHMTWDAPAMALHLWSSGWTVESACAFANDIPERDLWAELHARNEQAIKNGANL